MEAAVLPMPAKVERRVSGIKLFGDGANLRDFELLYKEGRVDGFTTNPTLMYKAGITDYTRFAHDLIDLIPDLPISFEVFSDDFDEMERQALLINSWGENIYVKIPVTNTKGESSAPLIRRLTAQGIKANVTAILTLGQVAAVVDALEADVPAIVSVFAGRIADTGVDPIAVMMATVGICSLKPRAEVLWASPREVLNIYQARDCGCQIITATPDILKKLDMSGMDLDRLSLDTVAMFYRDALAAQFKL